MAELFLNIADICPTTRALGPGLRAAIWVQGCPIGCKGCIAPEWIPIKPAHLLTPEVAGDRLLSNPEIEGITISGGEPMLQAEALTVLLRFIKTKKKLHIISFTGFRYETLLKWDRDQKVNEYLDEIDVLIDGPYIELLNKGQTFAGSANQRILNLSGRSFPGNEDWGIRKMEYHLRERNILAVGIPPVNWNRDPFTQQAINRMADVGGEK